MFQYEHPALDVEQIKKDLTLEEIQSKLAELQHRVSYAYRTGNQPLINQLSLIVNVYSRAQREILQDMFGNDDDQDLNGKIDIS